MDLITKNPGLRIEIDRLNHQFRKLCKTPKSTHGEDDQGGLQVASDSDLDRPFGFMYNLFQWAVIKGANDGKASVLSGQTDVSFRWGQIPAVVQHRLLAIALAHLIRDEIDSNEQEKAEDLLGLSEEELSEKLRETLEQLANRGLELMEMEIATESPDAYGTVENLIDTIREHSYPSN